MHTTQKFMAPVLLQWWWRHTTSAMSRAMGTTTLACWPSKYRNGHTYRFTRKCAYHVTLNSIIQSCNQCGHLTIPALDLLAGQIWPATTPASFKWVLLCRKGLSWTVQSIIQLKWMILRKCRPTPSVATTSNITIIIILWKFITCTESSIKHESEVRAVARWPDGVC